eukprot:scaffold390126_cov17-Prasinocladus_malaysianus.AAC.1
MSYPRIVIKDANACQKSAMPVTPAVKDSEAQREPALEDSAYANGATSKAIAGCTMAKPELNKQISAHLDAEDQQQQQQHQSCTATCIKGGTKRVTFHCEATEPERTPASDQDETERVPETPVWE